MGRLSLNHLSAPVGLEGEEITTLLAQRDLGAFRLSTRAYPARTRIPAHVHPGPHVSVVLAGEYTEIDGSGRRVHLSGSAALNGPGAQHEDVIGSHGARDLTVRMPHAWWTEVSDEDTPFALLGATEYDAPRITSALLRELTEPDDCSHLLVESALLEMFAAATRLRSSPATPPWLDAAAHLIAARYREDLRLGLIAAELRVHPVHLARRFRQRFGMSVGERIRGLRIAEACRLLGTTNLRLAEVALSAGFADQSHLCRGFARHLRMTPLQYRRLRTR